MNALLLDREFFQRGDAVRRGAFADTFQHQQLDAAAGLQQGARLLDARLRDEGAAIALALDDMIALQHGDGTADDGSADAEMRADDILGQLHAWAERALGDRFRERIADADDDVVPGYVADTLVHWVFRLPFVCRYR